MNFHEPKRIQEVLKDYDGLWMIAGGWAIDLYLNKISRKHEDIEIAIPRSEQLKIQSFLVDWNLRYVEAHQFFEWPNGQMLQLPIHEIHGQLNESKIEILLNEIEGEVWKFKRDLSIQYPTRKMIIQSAIGIPILCPEIVLLYKAKNFREKDQMDLLNSMAALSKDQLKWLKDRIQKMHGLNHQWIKILEKHLNS